jgi:enoyl-CoA hydratase
MNEFFSLDTDVQGISHLRMNRPERMNTMSPPFFPALRDAVRALHDEGRTRVLVI